MIRAASYRARGLAGASREGSHGTHATDLDKVLVDVGLSRERCDLINCDAALAMDPSGQIVVLVRTGLQRVRERFAIAHEIAHVLLADRQERGLNQSAGDAEHIREEELAVNAVAAELLVPSDRLSVVLGQIGNNSWASVERAAKMFAVSHEAMAWKIVEHKGVVGVLLEHRGNVVRVMSKSAGVEFRPPNDMCSADLRPGDRSSFNVGSAIGPVIVCGTWRRAGDALQFVGWMRPKTRESRASARC